MHSSVVILSPTGRSFVVAGVLGVTIMGGGGGGGATLEIFDMVFS